MTTPLTLAEFKVRLADRDAREGLGVDLTDQQALQVLANDQEIAELYIEWRTAPSPAPTAPETTPPPSRGFWKDPRTWVVGGAVVVALLVFGVFLTGSVMENLRKQEFAQLLDNDPTVSDSLRQLSGESLDAVFSTECAKVRDGWREQDQAAANANNWPAIAGSAEVSQAQYIANTMAIFHAAVKVCR